MKTYVATSNLGKLRELKALFARSPLEIVTPRKRIELDVIETAATYAGNALLKATALAEACCSRPVRVARGPVTVLPARTGPIVSSPVGAGAVITE